MDGTNGRGDQTLAAPPRERIGVVVIHGVGETHAGWINRYFVPYLERWSAYKSVGAPESQTSKPAQSLYHGEPRRRWLKWLRFGKKVKPGNELLLVLEAQDRPIVVALEEDLDFRNFCKIAGIEAYADFPEYRSRARRALHRDDLIYQLGMIVGLEPAASWLHHLHLAGVPCSIAFEPESTVHEVRDPGASKPDATWQAYSRTLRLDNKDAVFTELFWADLSKVGETNISQLSAMLQLFLESPFVLGNAFLKGCTGGIHTMISGLIKAANWVMHWPIAGLNVAILQSVFLLIIAHQFNFDELIFPLVVGSLALSMIGGVYLFRRLIHRRIGLAYLAISGAFYAGILLGILGVGSYYANDLSLATPDHYLIISIRLVLIAWTLWTVICAAAALLIMLVALKRVLPFGRRNVTVPLARASAALSLSLILGMMWKAALSALLFMVIVTLQGTGQSTTQGTVQSTGAAVAVISTPVCKPTMTFAEFMVVPHSSAQCALTSVKSLLLYIAHINTVSIILFMLTAMMVVSLRTGLIAWRSSAEAAPRPVNASSRARAKKRSKRARRSAKEKTRKADKSFTLPRLIASPAIVVVLFAGAVFNATALFLLNFDNIEFADWLARQAQTTSANSFLTGLLSIFLFIYLLRRIAEKSDGVVHIGRDLVDHQYDPSPRSLALRFQPKARKEKNRTGAAPYRPKRFQRRQRIQRRLEALIDDVIVKQQVDRLIFVSHSQGTVIMHDYLMNHDQLLHPAHDVTSTLPSVQRIDVMTLGSPLSHLYRYYFHDYDNPQSFDPARPPLIYKVHSWVNMWRLDDPIAGKVDLLGEIENIPLGAGGHTDYWKEAAVCERIWQLLVAPPQVFAQQIYEEDQVPFDDGPQAQAPAPPQTIAAQ